MSSSSYIGRIGGLAAALGVGAAILSAPGVAWAGPDAGGDNAAANTAADTATTTVAGSASADSVSGVAAPSEGSAGLSADTGSAGITALRGRAQRVQGAPPAASTTPPLASRSSVASALKAAGLSPVRNRPTSKPSVSSPRPAFTGIAAGVADPSSAAVSLPAPLASVVAEQPAPAASIFSSNLRSNLPASLLQTVTNAVKPPSVTSNPLTPPHGLANVIAGAVNRVTGAVGNVVNQIAQLFAGGPLTAVDSPLAWAFLAAVRKQLPGAAATGGQVAANQTTAATAEPTVFLNGYNVVPASNLDVVSLYGMYTHWPSWPGQVQGNQTFDLVDPATNQTVGSFKAMVGYQNSFAGGSYRELVVTEVLSGEAGTTAGKVPPVGSLISATGNQQFGTVYTAMPTTSGKNAVSQKLLTPFGSFPVFTTYDGAKNNTDNLLTYKPMELGKGYYMAPKTGATETQISVTGFPPLFTAVQGVQKFSVYDSSNNVVGSFDGLVTSTSDVAGIYTKAILVTATDAGANVGTEVSQVPPVGSVYNVIYFWNDKTYILYSSKPSSPRDVIRTKFVSPLGSSPLFTLLNASKAPVVKSYQVPGSYKFVPVSDVIPIGVNGLPPREVIVQGYQQFDVIDASGKKIGSFDADVSRQWDNNGAYHDAILVTNVTSGTGGIAPGDIPPVGSIFNFRKQLPGISDFYSSMPGPEGDLIATSFVTPFGFIPYWTQFDASKGLKGATYVNPYKV